MAGSRIYIGGAASNNKDIKEYAASDLMIVAIAAFVLIFLIMLVLTRSLMAAFVIPGTVAFSFAGAFGLVDPVVATPHWAAPALAGAAASRSSSWWPSGRTTTCC